MTLPTSPPGTLLTRPSAWPAEWVYWDYANPITPAEIAACSDGPFVLPNGAVICFVQDKVFERASLRHGATTAANQDAVAACRSRRRLVASAAS